jgi:D-arabinitol dehydrogenase (NADP+)
VVGDNTVLCGECYYCRRDQPLYCENFYSLGVNGPGGFSESVLVNQDKVFPISDSLSFDEASFTEPTACAIHGMDMIDLSFGDDVLVFGSGPTGIILAQLLKAGGAANRSAYRSMRERANMAAVTGGGWMTYSLVAARTP